MNRNSFALCTVTLAALAGSIALAQPATKGTKPATPAAPVNSKPVTATAPAKPVAPAAQPDMKGMPEGMKLPAGWTMEDMTACIQAGTPGDQHAMLTKGVGKWTGSTTQWMGPDSEGMKSQSTCTVTPIMDGRFVSIDWAGEMPGMGPYKGMGIAGFDNVSQKYVSTWIDNMGTGVMVGEGTMSGDGKTTTWNYQYNCPITKKPAVMREVETVTGPNSKTVEMYMNDPKSGKEYMMMKTELTRKA